MIIFKESQTLTKPRYSEIRWYIQYAIMNILGMLGFVPSDLQNMIPRMNCEAKHQIRYSSVLKFLVSWEYTALCAMLGLMYLDFRSVDWCSEGSAWCWSSLYFLHRLPAGFLLTCLLCPDIEELTPKGLGAGSLHKIAQIFQKLGDLFQIQCS